MTEVDAIKCKKCGDKIYSRARHDFRWCSCKSVAVDGGFMYTKICGDMKDIMFLGLVSVPYTKQELYDDWNKSIDKLGKL